MANSERADVTQATVIQIYETRTGSFDVHVGEDYTGDMTWDEMLGEVARLTMSGQPDRGRYIRSPEQWDARRDRLSRARAQSDQPPLQRAIDQRRGQL
jgi:hypothetical protein